MGLVLVQECGEFVSSCRSISTAKVDQPLCETAVEKKIRSQVRICSLTHIKQAKETSAQNTPQVKPMLAEKLSCHAANVHRRTNRNRIDHSTRRVIDTITIRPSVDIGSVAGEFLRKHRFHLRRVLGRSFLRLLDVGEGTDADLASYLLFDGGFAQRLIDLGRRDAAARADELAAFLYEH